MSVCIKKHVKVPSKEVNIYSYSMEINLQNNLFYGNTAENNTEEKKRLRMRPAHGEIELSFHSIPCNSIPPWPNI